MHDTAFQHANIVAEEVPTDIARSEQTILAAMNTYQLTNGSPSPPSPSMCPPSTTPTQDFASSNANAATWEATQLAILQLMKQIQDDMKKKPSPSSNNKRKLYCWTLGRCNHKSKDCKNKKEGHQDDATFINKKNGSTKGCTNEWWSGLEQVIDNTNYENN